MLTFLYSLIHSFTGSGEVSSAEYIIAASVGMMMNHISSGKCLGCRSDVWAVYVV